MALLAYVLDGGCYGTVLYLDADAVVVHARSFAWLQQLLLMQHEGAGLVVSREAEGPPDLVYRGERGRAQRQSLFSHFFSFFMKKKCQ